MNHRLLEFYICSILKKTALNYLSALLGRKEWIHTAARLCLTLNRIFQLTSEAMAMGKSKLSVICGSKIVDAVLAEGDAGISFENGINLAIYNRYELVGFAFSDAHRLIGNSVTDVDEGTDTTTIKFENNWALRIDMRDEAYTGPEAMQLRIPGGPIVIWS